MANRKPANSIDNAAAEIRQIMMDGFAGAVIGFAVSVTAAVAYRKMTRHDTRHRKSQATVLDANGRDIVDVLITEVWR